MDTYSLIFYRTQPQHHTYVRLLYSFLGQPYTESSLASQPHAYNRLIADILTTLGSMATTYFCTPFTEEVFLVYCAKGSRPAYMFFEKNTSERASTAKHQAGNRTT